MSLAGKPVEGGMGSEGEEEEEQIGDVASRVGATSQVCLPRQLLSSHSYHFEPNQPTHGASVLATFAVGV